MAKLRRVYAMFRKVGSSHARRSANVRPESSTCSNQRQRVTLFVSPTPLSNLSLPLMQHFVMLDVLPTQVSSAWQWKWSDRQQSSFPGHWLWHASQLGRGARSLLKLNFGLPNGQFLLARDLTLNLIKSFPVCITSPSGVLFGTNTSYPTVWHRLSFPLFVIKQILYKGEQLCFRTFQVWNSPLSLWMCQRCFPKQM